MVGSCSGFLSAQVRSLLGLSASKCLIPVAYGSSVAAKQTRQRKPRKKLIKEEADQLTCDSSKDSNDPPKLVFPFYGTALEQNRVIEHQLDHRIRLNSNKSFSGAFESYNGGFLSREESVDGRYYLYKSRDEERYRLPSVTTVLSATLPRSSWFGLNTWRKNQIEEHGEEEFKKMKKDAIRSGTLFHQLLEEELKSKSTSSCNDTTTTTSTTITTTNTVGEGTDGGLMPSKPPTAVNNNNTNDVLDENATDSNQETSENPSTDNNYFYSQSMKSVLSDIGDVVVTEGVVKHAELGYSGTVDCVAYYRGELCVIEWKTSNKPRPLIKDCHDYPLQIVAYAGALNNDPNYAFKVDKALIVIAYSTGEEAHSHVLDSVQCTEYWDKWLNRLNQFQTQFAHDLTNIYL